MAWSRPPRWDDYPTEDELKMEAITPPECYGKYGFTSCIEDCEWQVHCKMVKEDRTQ